ncbi:unnamed protein product [Rotaria sp. Silwood2]|nr:unnamed protein product [Rotaria sp. Silwood2]
MTSSAQRKSIRMAIWSLTCLILSACLLHTIAGTLKTKNYLHQPNKLTRHVLDGLNNDVSECYKKQKHIDHT